MKKIAMAMLALFLFGYSCGNAGGDDTDQTLTETEQQELAQEIEGLEAGSAEIDEAKVEIEESADKLDQLLNEL